MHDGRRMASRKRSMRDNRLTRSLLSLVLALALAPAVEAAVVTQAQGNDVGTLSGTASVSSATVAAVASGLSSQETTPVATRLALSAPSTCNAKQTVRVVASLTTSDGVPIPDAAAVIEKVASTRTVLGSGRTDASGTFAISVAPASRIVLEAASPARLRCFPAQVRPAHQAEGAAEHPVDSRHDRLPRPAVARSRHLWPKHATSSTGTTSCASV